MEERLKRQLDFALEMDKEKFIGRQTYLSDATRKENDAEHGWHLALMAMILQEYSNEPVDISRVVNMVIFHDVIEIDAGDTFAYDKEANKTKAVRETAAADRLYNILPKDQAKYYRELWDEFEKRETAESKFAHAMDSIQPLLLNHKTGGKSWREHKVEAASVYQRAKRDIMPASNTLYELACRIIEKNTELGNLIP